MSTIVLPQVQRPTKNKFSSQLGLALGQGISQGFSNAMDKREIQQNENKEVQFLNKLTGGKDFSGASTEMRQKAFEAYFKYELDKKSGNFDDKRDLEDYSAVKKAFGEKFANIWKASDAGAKTELIKNAMDSTQRGYSLDEMLTPNSSPQSNQMPRNEEDQSVLNNGKNTFQWPDYSRRPFGYNNKEWTDEKKNWRKENSPLFEENKTKLDSVNKDILSTKKLNKLNESKKLPEGFYRLTVNPETGETYKPFQLVGVATPEVQEWVKEIARFQNRAKDAYGSRVTNFDLVQYMKQFPNLVNTYEGRKRILRMMEINYELDRIYADSLDKVYKKYGLAGIPQEEADKLAQQFIQKDKDRLYNDYLGMEEDEGISNETNDGLSGQMVDVIGPDGQEYEIDQREVDQLPQGFKVK